MLYTSDSAREPAAAYAYDEFGNTEVRAGEDFFNEICYTGQIRDQSTGLYYYNARFYDPENGRFVSQDSYRGEQDEPGTWHLYAYCANDPVNFVDPSGHRYNPYYCKWGTTYSIRGKGTLKVNIGWWRSDVRKKVLSYGNINVMKKSGFMRITKVFKKQIVPQNKYVKKMNVRVAMAVWRWQIGGISRSITPWSMMLVDINVRYNNPQISYRTRSVPYNTYKKWNWGKF